jgi:hypothetical protein
MPVRKIEIIVHSDEVELALRAMKPSKQLMSDIVYGAGKPVKAFQEQHAPSNSGELSRSIAMNLVESSDTVAVLEVGPTVPYAVYIEYGTGVYAEGGRGRKSPWQYMTPAGNWITTIGIRPQPFVRPSIQDPVVIEEMVENVVDVIIQSFRDAGFSNYD